MDSSQQPGQQFHPILAGGVDVVDARPPVPPQVPGHHVGHRLVDPLGPQAPAKGKQAEPVLGDVQLLPGLPAADSI